jgi:hypothetical protein
VIKRIGSAVHDSTVPLALIELEDGEWEALARIVNLAEAHLDEIPYPNLRSRRKCAEEVIARLRDVLALPLPVILSSGDEAEQEAPF